MAFIVLFNHIYSLTFQKVIKDLHPEALKISIQTLLGCHIVPGWPDMQFIPNTIICHSRKTVSAYPIRFLFFFYGHIMEILSTITLYDQLMTLMSFCMVIQ